MFALDVEAPVVVAPDAAMVTGAPLAPEEAALGPPTTFKTTIKDPGRPRFHARTVGLEFVERRAPPPEAFDWELEV